MIQFIKNLFKSDIRKSCSNCEYFYMDQCRRYPPTQMNVGCATDSWPIVGKDEFCGEHKQRKII